MTLSRPFALLLVFIGAFLILAFHIDRVGLAETWVDPVTRLAAQDEAVYSSTAMHMAAHGGWLTPMFMGRYAFYKPPLLYWACGAAVKIFGPSNWALRLPCLLAGALIVMLIFAWLWEARSLVAAFSGASLLVSNHMFHTLARATLTDMTLTLFIASAMWCLFQDTQLASPRYFWLFAVATGLAIMTKGVAGLLPLLMLVGAKVRWQRLVQLCLVVVLVAAPWHLYQLATHTRWFWAEYVLTEHFTWGLSAPHQTSAENQLLFYVRRLALLDPVLCLLALPAIAVAFRERNILGLTWIATVFVACLAFHYRNAAYLLPLIPALCLLTGRISNPFILAALVAVFAIKSYAWNQVWGLPYHPEHPIPSVAALTSYSSWHRPKDLIVVDPDDELVSAVLPLRRLRYCFLEPKPQDVKLPLDFEYLGITVTADQFNDMGRWRGVFEQRLHDWGLPSPEPIATVILLRSPDQLQPLIAMHPRSDFSLPERLSKIEDSAHYRWQVSARRVFLLANVP